MQEAAPPTSEPITAASFAAGGSAYGPGCVMMPRATGPIADPAAPSAEASGARLVFEDRKRFYWKTGLLAATTIALVPILLSRSEWAAKAYLVALVVVHVAGIFIVAIGVRRRDIAPHTRGLVIRLVAIVILVGLLYLASQGLHTETRDLLFWGSLFLIWLLHTLGLALLHIKGRREAACPFV